MIMNYIRRIRSGNDEDEAGIIGPRPPIRSLLYGSIYYKLKKIALEVMESTKFEYNNNSETSVNDCVRRFIIYCFKLAIRSRICPKACKEFLEIMKLLPNRFKLVKAVQRIKEKKMEERSLILCLLKLQELKCELVESPSFTVSYIIS